MYLRNQLTHPKVPPVITIKKTKQALEAIISTIDVLFKVIYKSEFPIARKRANLLNDFLNMKIFSVNKEEKCYERSINIRELAHFSNRLDGTTDVADHGTTYGVHAWDLARADNSNNFILPFLPMGYFFQLSSSAFLRRGG